MVQVGVAQAVRTAVSSMFALALSDVLATWWHMVIS